MARIIIPDEIRIIDQPDALSAYLEAIGVHHERWPIEERVDPDAPAAAILTAYARELDRLKERGGYGSADVVDLTPETANLEAMLDWVRKEHTHSEDEVCFVLKGHGVYHFHPEDGPIIRVDVEPGDLIVVPRGLRHWSDLGDDRTLRAIRLCQDASGWKPLYVPNGQHGKYQPANWARGEFRRETSVLGVGE